MQDKKEVISKIFSKMYTPDGTEEVEKHIANMKFLLENIPRVESVITSRVKAPLSVLKKLHSSDKYARSWNYMKDLLGFMVVVDTNQDVDNVLYYIEEHLSDVKNPNSELLFRDYRVQNYRNKNGLPDDSHGIYDAPSQKGYQIHNGYKSVRINVMVEGYPIEIQVKTKEQYIAHVATHDPVYKSPWLKNKDEETMMGGALFPYFEACSHLDLHRHEMTEKQIMRCKLDINRIFERNKILFNTYPMVFNDACRIYAVYMFILKNQDQIYADSVLTDSVLKMKLLESEVLRIFHYKQKEKQRNDDSLTENASFVNTVQEIINMDYEEFKQLREQIAGSYRMNACVITGLYDLIRKEDIEVIKKFSESFRRVQVSVFDDELARLYLGTEPMFTFEEREERIKMIKGVSDVTKVGVDGQINISNGIAPLNLDIPQPKKYKIGCISGCFDMLTPGHLEYINEAIDLCDYVIIGLKSDDYMINIKGKEPVLRDDERIYNLSAIRGVGGVYLTDYTIALHEEVRDILAKEAKNGGKCAIFAGSDWFLKPEEKGARSCEELKSLIGVGSFQELGIENLQELYKTGKLEIPTNIPNVVIACIPREKDGVVKSGSSSDYREKGIWSRDNVRNIHELKAMGE